MVKKFGAVLCLATLLASLFGMFSVIAADYVMEKPLEPSIWEEPNFDTDHAYSFAFVGDTQCITCGDALLGTKKLKHQYKYIADTAKDRKLEHVFVLGDITDGSYHNDANMAGRVNSYPDVSEWLVAKEAIFQLNGSGVTYSLCRGNHDDYMIDYFFNVPAYTDQFKDVGGFFSDSDAKWTDIEGVTKSRETDNPEAYVYWDALTEKHHEETIVNSWMTKEICGTKYLFITVDFDPTNDVLDWLDEILAQYPDHKAIVTTHSYLNKSGDLIQKNDDCVMYLFDNAGDDMWEKVLRKHENVFMVVSGHVGVNDIVYSYQTGDRGNKVLQVLVDPQGYDANEVDSNRGGKQDTGMVLYMNFSEDGKKITFDYYSTLLGKFMKNNEHTFYVDDCSHAWDEGFLVSLPTEKKSGKKLYTCTKCDKTKTVTLQRLGKTDARYFEEFGQQHHYLGDAIATDKPNVTDGVVLDGEYLHSFEYSPSSSKKIVTIEGSKTNGYTDTESIKTHMSYDEKYFYLAFEIKDKLYCPGRDGIMVNLCLRDGGSKLDAVSRMRYTFKGRSSESVLVGNDVGTTISVLQKDGKGNWINNCEGAVINEHVPERSLYWDDSKDTLTIEMKFNINAMLDYWNNDKEAEDAVLYYYPLIEMYGNSADGAGDAPVSQGLLWYYFDNTAVPNINSDFAKEYPGVNYNMNWFPHIVHFSHNWDEGVKISDSTHLEHGIVSYKCKDCDSAKTEKLLKIPHEYDENGKCIECGYSDAQDDAASTSAQSIQSPQCTEAPKTKGCKSSIELSVSVIVTCICGAALISRKRYAE